MHDYNSITKSYPTKVKLSIPLIKCTKIAKGAKCTEKYHVWCIIRQIRSVFAFLPNVFSIAI